MNLEDLSAYLAADIHYDLEQADFERDMRELFRRYIKKILWDGYNEVGVNAERAIIIFKGQNDKFRWEVSTIHPDMIPESKLKPRRKYTRRNQA